MWDAANNDLENGVGIPYNGRPKRPLIKQTWLSEDQAEHAAGEESQPSRKGHTRNTSIQESIFGGSKPRRGSTTLRMRFKDHDDPLAAAVAGARAEEDARMREQKEYEHPPPFRKVAREFSGLSALSATKGNGGGRPPNGKSANKTAHQGSAEMPSVAQQALLNMQLSQNRGRSQSDLHLHTNAKGVLVYEKGPGITPVSAKPLRNVQTAKDVDEEEVEEEKEIMIGEIRLACVGLKSRTALTPNSPRTPPAQSVNIRKELKAIRSGLLFCVLVLLIAYVTRGQVPKIDIVKWVLFAVVVLVSLPLLRFTARVFAYVFTRQGSTLLYRGNLFYFPVALHQEIAFVAHAAILVAMWDTRFKDWVIDNEHPSFQRFHNVLSDILESYLALRVGLLIKCFIVLFVAITYLWRPYLERVKSSILAQYILLLLTDWCIKGSFNSEDERFAIQMSRQGTQWKNITLYALSKAMAFVPRNTMGQSGGKGPGDEGEGDAMSEAKYLGNTLFQKLLANAAQRRAEAAAAGGTEDGAAKPYKNVRNYNNNVALLRSGGPDPAQMRLPRPPGHLSRESTASSDGTGWGLGEIHGGGGGGLTKGKRLSGVIEGSLAAVSNTIHTITGGSGGSGGTGKRASRRAPREEWPAEVGVGISPDHAVLGKDDRNVFLDRGGDLEEGEGGAGDGAGVGAGGGAGDTPVPLPKSEFIFNGRGIGVDEEGKEEVGLSDGGAEVEGKGKEKETETEMEENGKGAVLLREELCPKMDQSLLDVAFDMFDLDNSGTISRDEMVAGVVRTYKDHKNLAMTLDDSERITKKLGQMVMSVICFILIFVWLSIWGQDVLALSLTFSSFLIAFSFMIGPAAANLMSSVIFIFVMRAFDVGDRIFLYPGRPGDPPLNLKVVQINLLSTVFKRWDEQLYYIPNQVLATTTIVNIQRTGHQWHEFHIQVAASTSSDKIAALHRALISFAENHDTPGSGLYSNILFSLTGIEDSTRLTIRIVFQQKSNWQEMQRKWEAQSLCTMGIKRACEKLRITYTMPALPIIKGGVAGGHM